MLWFWVLYTLEYIFYLCVFYSVKRDSLCGNEVPLLAFLSDACYQRRCPEKGVFMCLIVVVVERVGSLVESFLIVADAFNNCVSPLTPVENN